MPPRDPAVYLDEIERSLAALARYPAGVSLESYLANDEKRLAAERVLEFADEALSKRAQTAPEWPARIPQHRSIVAFHKVLAPGDAQLDDVKVYETALFKAPQLLAVASALLLEVDDSNPPA